MEAKVRRVETRPDGRIEAKVGRVERRLGGKDRSKLQQAALNRFYLK